MHSNNILVLRVRFGLHKFSSNKANTFMHHIDKANLLTEITCGCRPKSCTMWKLEYIYKNLAQQKYAHTREKFEQT
jgi:hypothetical protein